MKKNKRGKRGFSCGGRSGAYVDRKNTEKKGERGGSFP